MYTLCVSQLCTCPPLLAMSYLSGGPSGGAASFSFPPLHWVLSILIKDHSSSQAAELSSCTFYLWDPSRALLKSSWDPYLVSFLMIFFPSWKALLIQCLGHCRCAVYNLKWWIVEMYKYMLSHNLLENFLEVPVTAQIWGRRQCPGVVCKTRCEHPEGPCCWWQLPSTSWIGSRFALEQRGCRCPLWVLGGQESCVPLPMVGLAMQWQEAGS